MIFPENVQFLSTPRLIKNGASNNNYKNFNLANHVGDEPSAVLANRQLLVNHYNLPSEPKWLDQYHSNICVSIDSPDSSYLMKADSCITQTPGVVCAVLTADCLPVFLCKKDGSAVGIVHAGWRGLLSGVIESCMNAMDVNKGEILAHLGPAISQKAFEVGAEVRELFVDSHSGFENTFIQHNNKYMMDLYAAARIVLNDYGVISITGGEQCTYSEQEKYYSYRRDGEKSGRMAHLIWML